MAKELQYTPKDLAVNLLCRETTNEIHNEAHSIACGVAPIPNKFKAMVNETLQKKNLSFIEKYDYISSFIFDSMFKDNLIQFSKKIDNYWLVQENKILPLPIQALIIQYSTTSYELPNKVCIPFEKGKYGTYKLRKIIDKINNKYR